MMAVDRMDIQVHGTSCGIVPLYFLRRNLVQHPVTEVWPKVVFINGNIIFPGVLLYLPFYFFQPLFVPYTEFDHGSVALDLLFVLFYFQ